MSGAEPQSDIHRHAPPTPALQRSSPAGACPRELGPASSDPADASLIRGPLGAAALYLGSLAVMAPWPILGIMLVRSIFERESEALALFGGVTLFPLMILGIVVPLPEPVILGVMVLVWFAAALVPDLLLRRRLRTWPAIAALLGMQSGFSLAQAVMGALLLMGRSV